MTPAVVPPTEEEEVAIRLAWARIGAWEQTTGAEDQRCPLCDGEGFVDGIRYDAESVCPATIVGYGIGEGLFAAELVAESTGALLAAIDAERETATELLAALEQMVRSAHPNPIEHPAMTAAWVVAKRAINAAKERAR